MARRPPEILITTPESLNLLLTSQTGRTMLSGIAAVILDEVHAIAGNKRGTHLITAVDRLVPLSGEFQRIALSATVNPPERVAGFTGGFRRIGSGSDTRYEQRPVSIIRSDQAKHYEIRVSFPSDARETMVDGSWWPSLVRSFKEIIGRHRSTLLFANSRRTAEKVTRLINEGEQTALAYAHHGSLARELRLAVEQKLKQGELKAIVATSSLELGIDIGALDRVILVQTPRSVASSVQRVGRSGHQVGETSRGVIFPTHGRDFLEAAVMARAIRERDIEEIRPVEAPLDILAQVILSMTAAEPWDRDELHSFLRTSWPFRNLGRRQFDSVLDMLGGRYEDTRIRELRARVSVDRIDNTVRAYSQVPYLLYLSGGTIPERGYFHLRIKDSHARIGELDEEFVWERSIGEAFTFGTQLWRIENITHNDVEVSPVRAGQGIFPFWKAEEQNRDFHLSSRIGNFLEEINDRLDDPGLRQELLALGMDEAAAAELIAFLKLQQQATGSGLPHRHHLLVEHVDDPAGNGDRRQVILHTGWGGRINRPFALALEQAWEARAHTPLRTIVDDDAVLLMFPGDADPLELVRSLSPETIEVLLRKKLEQSGFFGARFRENAERALLLPKAGFRRRMPLWLIRLRAKELFAAVHRFGDFPILLETWRTCLNDEFDLENLKTVLDEVRERVITVTETRTRAASPFAGRLAWKRTNELMYEDDTPLTRQESGLMPELLKEIISSPHLRPAIPQDVIRAADEKLKRTAPGYTPASAHELLDWIKDRMLIPEPEWNQLAASILRDHGQDPGAWMDMNAGKISWISWPGVRSRLLTSMESIPKVLVAFRLLREDVSLEPVSSLDTSDDLKRRAGMVRHGKAFPAEEYDLSVFLAAWLSFYGPVEKEVLTRTLGITPERLDQAIEPLIENRTLAVDRFHEESRDPEVCDIQNLELLLRMARRFRQPVFEALPPEQLPLFMAVFQGILPRGGSIQDLQQRLEQLFGWPAAAAAWEEFLLPARIKGYRSEWLDSLLGSDEVIWFGCGQRRISIAFTQDLELFRPAGHHRADGEELDQLIPDRRGRYSFFEIAAFSRMDTVHASDLLWKEAWKGHVTSDTFRTVRTGALTGFTARAFPEEPRLASRRSGFNRWKVSRPVEGHWLRIDQPPREQDRFEEEELVKDRIRQLFRRYGLLFREILQNETPVLQWRAVFRSLQLMELSGEILSGYFFRGIPGPQFASHEAFRMLREPLPGDAVYWLNASDPASVCGLSLVPGHPPRVASTFLVYQGSSLIMICKRLGKNLDVRTGPDDPRFPEYLELFREMLNREFNPIGRITVETINGEPAAGSAYAPALKRFGFRSSRSTLELWKEY